MIQKVIMALKQICRICLSYMQHHPELKEWVRCCCGYTKLINPLISQEDYYQNRDVEYAEELTKEMQENATVLLEKVNGMLNYMKVKEEFWENLPKKVSSGWRPKAVNTKAGGGKKSAHLDCRAIDIVDDKEQSLCMELQRYPEVLEKFGLYMEDPKYTKGKFTNWTHLQTRPTKSGRIFRPF